MSKRNYWSDPQAFYFQLWEKIEHINQENLSARQAYEIGWWLQRCDGIMVTPEEMYLLEQLGYLARIDNDRAMACAELSVVYQNEIDLYQPGMAYWAYRRLDIIKRWIGVEKWAKVRLKVLSVWDDIPF